MSDKLLAMHYHHIHMKSVRQISWVPALLIGILVAFTGYILTISTTTLALQAVHKSSALNMVSLYESNRTRLPQAEEKIKLDFSLKTNAVTKLSVVGFLTTAFVGGAISYYLAKRRNFLSSLLVGVIFSCIIVAHLIGMTLYDNAKRVQLWRSDGISEAEFAPYLEARHKEIMSHIVNFPVLLAKLSLASTAGGGIIWVYEKYRKIKKTE